MLAEEGFVAVIVTIDKRTGEIVTGPEIITRGWVHATEAEDLLEEAKQVVRVALEAAAREGATDFETMRRHTRRAVGRFISDRTKRRPAVIPVVLEV
jgi:ribonuclease J